MDLSSLEPILPRYLGSDCENLLLGLCFSPGKANLRTGDGSALRPQIQFLAILLKEKNCLILLLELPFASVQPKLERGKITINPEKRDQGNAVNVFLISPEVLFLAALAHRGRPRAAGSPCSSDHTSPPGHVHVQVMSGPMEGSSPHSCPTSAAPRYVSTMYIPTSPGS